MGPEPVYPPEPLMFGLGASIGAPWLLGPTPISCSMVKMDVPIADAIAATGGIHNFFTLTFF